jgi:transcriptional regulator of acetoin/glycerol metabolism
LDELAQVRAHAAPTALTSAVNSATTSILPGQAPWSDRETGGLTTAATTEAPADAPMDPRQRLQDVAIAAMAHMLRLHNGNVSAAAKALGVSRNTIYRKKDLLPPDLLR